MIPQQKLDYTTIANLLRMVSWNDYCDATCAVSLLTQQSCNQRETHRKLRKEI